MGNVQYEENHNARSASAQILEAAMKARTLVMTAAATLAVTAALSACGSATTTNKPAAAGTSSPSATPTPSSSAPSLPVSAGGAPMIAAIRLSANFSPDSVTLAAGQKFQVIVSSSVAPTGTAFPHPCSTGVAYAAAGNMLSVSCPASGGFLFTAEQAGTTTLTATVKPNCAPGEMCPQWITEAVLHVTIT
jgi:hypothetical protein